MSRDPYAPPESKEEQFAEVARILGVALHRWHRLNRGKVVKSDCPSVLPTTGSQSQREALAESEQMAESSSCGPSVSAIHRP
jgi:hypothetical protein